jgi:hypothetical protein
LGGSPDQRLVRWRIVILEASIRTPDGTRTATADGAYDAAKAELEQQVAEGEQLLSFRRLDD